MDFNHIRLKPLSLTILTYLAAQNDEVSAESIAEALSLKTRQVDAAITKSLVRYSFVKREARFTKILKKQHKVVFATERGKGYIHWLNQLQEKERN